MLYPLQLLYLLSAVIVAVSGRQTPGIRLVKTNSYRQPIRRQVYSIK